MGGWVRKAHTHTTTTTTTRNTGYRCGDPQGAGRDVEGEVSRVDPKICAEESTTATEKNIEQKKNKMQEEGGSRSPKRTQIPTPSLYPSHVCLLPPLPESGGCVRGGCRPERKHALSSELPLTRRNPPPLPSLPRDASSACSCCFRCRGPHAIHFQIISGDIHTHTHAHTHTQKGGQ